MHEHDVTAAARVKSAEQNQFSLIVWQFVVDLKRSIVNVSYTLDIETPLELPLPQALGFQSQAGELEARETGDEHAKDHGKEKGERRNAREKTCRFLGNFVVFSSWYFSRVFKP